MCTRQTPIAKATKTDLADEIKDLTASIKELTLDIGDLDAAAENEKLAEQLRQLEAELEAELAQRKQQTRKD